MKRNPFDEMTLCYICKGDFENTGEYNIRRTKRRYKRDEKKEEEKKKQCTYCSYRDGYDYIVTRKDRKEGRK
jgi:hypothetical protein